MLRLVLRRAVVLAAALALCGVASVLHAPSRGGREVPPAEPVAVAWAFEPPQRGAFVSSPLAAGGRVYAAAIHSTAFRNAGAVYCLDAASGKPLWRFDDGGKMLHMYSSPCLAGGRLYVGEGMHANFTCRLYCLDATTGRKVWNFQAEGHIESSPRVAGGKVYFGAGDDGLYCLDAATGKRRWQLRGPFHIDSSPAVSAGRVFAGSGTSRAHRNTEALCLDAESGRVVWRAPMDLPVWGSPAVGGADVYFGLGNGRLLTPAEPPEKPAGALVCLTVETGRMRWRYDAGDGVFARAAVGPRHVWFGSRDGHCYCLDRRTGRVVWRRDLGSPVMTSPALAGDRLFVVATAGRVCCLEPATGRVRWAFDVARHSGAAPRLYSSPAVTAGRRGVVFGAELRAPGSQAAVLYCLRD